MTLGVRESICSFLEVGEWNVPIWGAILEYILSDKCMGVRVFYQNPDDCLEMLQK